MKNRDELEGKAREIQGKAKQAVGQLTDDEQLINQGLEEEASGELQGGFGRARRKVGEAIEEVGERLKR